MQGSFLPRKLQARITRGLADFPVVAVLGPRHGKTTLVRETVAEPYPLRQGVSVAPLAVFLSRL